MKFKKLISNSLAIGLIFNNASISLASLLSEDGRYETFINDELKVENILEDSNVSIEIYGNTLVNLLDIASAGNNSSALVDSINLDNHSFDIKYLDNIVGNTPNNRAFVNSDFVSKLKENTTYTFSYDYELLENPNDEESDAPHA